MADLHVQRQGAEIGFAHDQSFWGTLEQFVGLRAVVEVSANAAGITNPDELRTLPSFEFQRGKRGSVFTFRGTGKSPKQAEDLTNKGMEYLASSWNASRAEDARLIRQQLIADISGADKTIAALRERLNRMQSGKGLAGRPTDLLTWTQGQINALQGSIATAKIDIGVAQDRLQALHTLARREESLPPEQRLVSTQAGGLVGVMQARLVQLETERLQMLDTRTEVHPRVVALDREIKALRERIAEETKGSQQTSASPVLPSALQDQITAADLDLRAAQRRLTAFTAEEATLRQRTPELQKLAYEYGTVETELSSATGKRNSYVEGLAQVDSEIQRLASAKDLRVTSKAQALPSPKKLSKYAMMVVAGSFAGFIMGCMLIFMLHYVDLTFKNEAEAEHLLGYPVLAGIPRSDIEVVASSSVPEPAPGLTEEGGGD